MTQFSVHNLTGWNSGVSGSTFLICGSGSFIEHICRIHVLPLNQASLFSTRCGCGTTVYTKKLPPSLPMWFLCLQSQQPGISLTSNPFLASKLWLLLYWPQRPKFKEFMWLDPIHPDNPPFWKSMVPSDII